MNPLPLAINNLKRRPLRNWLTVLGVVIGIAAIVGLLNVGQSLQESINSIVEDAGVQTITIQGRTPGAPGSNADLTEQDLSAVEGMSEFSAVSAFIFRQPTVEYVGETKRVFVVGVTNQEEGFGAYGLKLDEGRWLQNQDTGSAVVGFKFGELYDTKTIIGSQIKIDETKFKIVGIMESMGNPQDDTTVYIPYDSAEELFGVQGKIGVIQAAVKTGLDVNEVAKKTSQTLKRKRGNEDFIVSTPEQLLEQFGTILNIVNVVVIGVAAISLLVGSVGILNSMYTAVLERTQEIGIMKAVGAANNQILALFITEAALIGAVGGIIGTLIGLGIGQLVGIASAAAGWEFITVKPSIPLIFFGVGFATLFGGFSGYFPAVNASKLQPVDSLRDA